MSEFGSESEYDDGVSERSDLRPRLDRLESVVWRHPRLARGPLHAALARAEAEGDAGGEALALCLLAGCAYYAGDHAETLSLSSRALTLAQESGDDPLTARLLSVQGLALARLGQALAAQERYLQSLAIARRLGSSFAIFRVLSNLTWLLLRLGEHRAALETQLEAVQLLGDDSTREQVAAAATNLISIHALMGRHEEVLRLAEEHLGQIQGTRRMWEWSVQADVSGALLALGNEREALHAAVQGLGIAQELQDVEGLGTLHLRCASALLALGRPGEARAQLQQAQAVIRDLHCPTLESELERGWAELLARDGDFRRAHAHSWRYFGLREAIRAQGAELRARTLAHQLNYERETQVREVREAERQRTSELQQVSSELEQARDQLRQHGGRDALTALPGRAMLAERMEGQSGCLLWINIDRFQAVNEGFGYAAGDEVLRAYAARLSATLKDRGLLARVGGDEFAVLLDPEPPVPGGDAAEPPTPVAVQQVLAALRRPFRVRGQTLTLRSSLGTAWAPRDGEDPETLFPRAALAAREARRRGGDGVCAYHPGIESQQRRLRQLERELPGAADRGELFVEYQPLFRIDGSGVPLCFGAEALLRWQHPELGLITPGEFIPIAEESGDIVTLGRWVLAQACRDAQRLGFDERGWQVSVNVSALQFGEPGFLNGVRHTLEDSGLPAHALTLELTETMLLRDFEASRALLTRFQALGIHTAMDDFGSGYSSLGVLRSLPLSMLKLDRSFLVDLPRCAPTTPEGVREGKRQNQQVLRTIIELAHHLGLSVTAEGVETAEHFRLLHALGCDAAQGFWLSRPLPVGELENSLLYVPS